MTTYLKHVEIIKFSDTTKCDISLDSPLKVSLTLKNSTLFPLPSSRKLVVNALLKHVEIINFYASLTCDMSLDSPIKN